MKQRCFRCGGPVEITGTFQGRPRESQVHCADPTCDARWVDQNPMRFGEGKYQFGFGSNGIVRLKHGRPSEGESNCTGVCKVLLEVLGDQFKVGAECPSSGTKHNARQEQGVDFSIIGPCGHELEIQVTRPNEQSHFAELAKSSKKGVPLIDSREHEQLRDNILHSILAKTHKTPRHDRRQRLLAIDGRDLTVGFSFILSGKRIHEPLKDLGWAGVALVVDESNSQLLCGSDLQCPQCSASWGG